MQILETYVVKDIENNLEFKFRIWRRLCKY